MFTARYMLHAVLHQCTCRLEGAMHGRDTLPRRSLLKDANGRLMTTHQQCQTEKPVLCSIVALNCQFCVVLLQYLAADLPTDASADSLCWRENCNFYWLNIQLASPRC